MITIHGYEINDKQFESMFVSEDDDFYVSDEEIENFDSFTKEEEMYLYEV